MIHALYKSPVLRFQIFISKAYIAIIKKDTSRSVAVEIMFNLVNVLRFLSLQCVCTSCGATSDPLPFIQMVHYISTTSLW